MVALCGEYPIPQVQRLPGGAHYKARAVTALKQNGLLRVYSRDHLRGLRLTAAAKRMLLADDPACFSRLLTGCTETNLQKSEVPRRLRLHRMAEALTAMYSAGVPALPWEKPPLSGLPVAHPAYYSSRELKSIGPQGAKIKNARATGILATAGDIFAVYNTGSGRMKWDHRAEMRLKALLQGLWPQKRPPVDAILLGDSMERLAAWADADCGQALLNGDFAHVYFLTNDRRGDALLRLLCNPERQALLDGILSENLLPPDAGFPVEHDGLDGALPVLFGYSCDLPRLRRFDTALSLRETPGVLLCFDYQEAALRQCCGPWIRFQCIDFAACERSIFHDP